MIKKTNKVWLTVAASALVLSLSTGAALAYFSDYTSAAGAKQINLGAESEIDETLEGGVKTICIRNTGDTNVYVRVAVVYGGSMEASVDLGEGWSDGEDGYYYFAEELKAADSEEGTATTDIVVTPTVETIANDTDIIIIEECVQHIFDEPNGPDYTGWTLVPDSDISYNAQ